MHPLHHHTQIYGDIWRQLQQMQAEHEATGAAHVPPTMAAGVLDGLQQLLPAQQSLQASPFDANTAQVGCRLECVVGLLCGWVSFIGLLCIRTTCVYTNELRNDMLRS